MAGNLPLRASFETTGVMIAGPGRNKTTAMVVPNILDAPGTVITTSVRPDVFESTVGYRSTVGRIHVFDPQGNAPTAADSGVWWNPLAAVRSLEDAEDLAAVFAARHPVSALERGSRIRGSSRERTVQDAPGRR